MRSWSHLPGWPHVLEAALVAAYLSLAESTFHREVKAGRIPPPIAVTEGRRGWDRLTPACCTDPKCGRTRPNPVPGQAMRTEIGRPKSSMRLRA